MVTGRNCIASVAAVLPYIIPFEHLLLCKADNANYDNFTIKVKWSRKHLSTKCYRHAIN